jgi:hypothetical protein
MACTSLLQFSDRETGPPTAERRERLATIERMTTAIEAELAAIDALPAALLRETVGGGDVSRGAVG